MANIKYKQWELTDEFSVQDMIDMTTPGKKDAGKFIQTVIILLESKRVKGPEITTKILVKDYKQLIEKVSKSFQ